MLALAALSMGCNPGSRHKVLSVLFDGVPAPQPAGSAAGAETPGAPTLLAAGSEAGFVHGPYAARECQACHRGGGSNALVAPPDRLCAGCHELKLDKRYVHGPIASGGCLVCHDPHSSKYRFLLVADAATFCLRCHDRAALQASPAHTDPARQCTECHDAHMSDRRYLLK